MIFVALDAGVGLFQAGRLKRRLSNKQSVPVERAIGSIYRVIQKKLDPYFGIIMLS